MLKRLITFSFLVFLCHAFSKYNGQELWLSSSNSTDNKTCSYFSSSTNNTNGNCSACSMHSSCFWCQDTKLCLNSSEVFAHNNCSSGWCSGNTCSDTCTDFCTTSFPCGKTKLSLILLILFYGLILGASAKLISDGSEMMLELFPSYGTVIGALLLPILGAIPDAAIILVSGALGPKEEAQSQLSVGVGTLAGSTIMVLTVPWSIGLWLGRTDSDEFGEGRDRVCTYTHLSNSVVSVDTDTATNARIMLASSISYFIVQGVAFYYVSNPDSDAAISMEKYFALTGMIVCFLGLLAYCIYQVFVPKLAEKRKLKIEKEMEQRNLRLRAIHIVKKMGWDKSVNEKTSTDTTQATALNAGLLWKRKAFGQVNEEVPLHSGNTLRNDEDSDEEEPPQGSFAKNLTISISLMVFGTLLVAFFSDPMVDVIDNFGTAINVPAFYVSFIITPYCSNASELVSSLIFASKKRKANSSMTYSQIYGAATMNNTLGLGIFFALVFFRGLAWTFSAETLTIFLITLMVGIIGQSVTNIKLFWSIPVILLYPLSLVIVWTLENFAHWQ
eukprot:TRINITY_DN1903_c0_g1_i1.p1 TRINITY_DN1903_c0_g1~~TRINITY_DN1903_c0_g1_i1.p1  ORF type:complete len:556 (-),score=72.88 TRINITY_DN1903_c0_g1_i1:45-1712(-)